MRYGSVCSGIEAASVAWHPLGWEPQWFSEIDKFPSAVLAERFPTVPNLGDMTKIQPKDHGSIDLLVGGTPCQSFSVAGLRKGMADPRGNLALEFLRLADAARPKWIVWENVPGVLSSNGGRDFGAFLGALGQLGYGWAYRILDAQYFGVPQRRRRVFVVGCSGDWRAPAAVLFERASLRGDSPPSREAREGAAAGAGKGVAKCLNAHGGIGRLDAESETLIPSHWEGGPHPTLNQSHNAGGIGASNQEVFSQRGGGLVPHAFDARQSDVLQHGDKAGQLDTDWHSQAVYAIQERACAENPECGPGGVGVRGDGSAYTLEARSVSQAVCFDPNQVPSKANRSNPQPGDPCHTIPAATTPPMLAGSHVRRLTPRECERLQGFPDDWTRIPWRGKPANECPDGPRYKACGNSMAVPVMRWIGKRIVQVEALKQ